MLVNFWRTLFVNGRPSPVYVLSGASFPRGTEGAFAPLGACLAALLFIIINIKVILRHKREIFVTLKKTMLYQNIRLIKLHYIEVLLYTHNEDTL